MLIYAFCEDWNRMWLDATAKQNKSGNSGGQKRRVEEHVLL
jgi:hypothetical protein